MGCDEVVYYEPWYQSYIEALKENDLRKKIYKLYDTLKFDKISSSEPYVVLANLIQDDHERINLYTKALEIDGNPKWDISLKHILKKIKLNYDTNNISDKPPSNIITKKIFIVIKKNCHINNFNIKNKKILLDYNYKNFTYDFVINKNNELKLGCKHNYLADYDAWVFGAGRIKIDEFGNVLEIDNFSGHFLPTEKQFYSFLKFFEKNNIQINDAKITVFRNKNTILKNCHTKLL